MDDKDTLKDILSRATEELNKANGSAREMTLFDQPLSDPDVPDAERLRQASERTAQAVEAQAEERLAVAMSLVAEAKALQEKAKGIADGIRQHGIDEAERVILSARMYRESAEAMMAVRDKFQP